MDAQAIIAIVGGVALMVGILGGGVKMKELEIPPVPLQIRILSGITGAFLLGILIFRFDLGRNNTPTSTSTIVASILTSTPTIAAFVPTETPTITPSSTFTVHAINQINWLENPITDSDIIEQGRVVFDYSTETLKLSGQTTGDRIWINSQSLPENSKTTLVMRYPNRLCTTLIGFGDGINWKPEYRVQIANGKLTLGYISSDAPYSSIKETDIVTAQNYPIEFVVEKRVSGISVSVTGQPDSLVSIQNDENLPANTDDYNRLFLSVIGGEDSCVALIEALKVESTDRP